MAFLPKKAEDPASLLVGPTEDEWRAMTPAEREQRLVAINEILTDRRNAMSEGRRHKKAKGRAADMLGFHFARAGRVVYVADELSVVYPGEEAFVPDVLAVVDVPQPEDDPRMAWVVMDEGRGLDFVLEVLYRGDRKKDLVGNVDRYARLGIPEYFVYDRLHQKLHGYRLPGPTARRYQPIVPQFGRHASAVLGLELMVGRDGLRFFVGGGELVDTGEWILRLENMVTDLEARAREAEAQAEQAQAEAEQAQAEAERAQAQALQGGILAVLRARQLAVSDEERARVMACEELPVLQAWLVRAATVSTAADVFTG